MEKVLIAMSGGVDSSVAALLLREQGIECIGCTMKLYGNELVNPKNEKSCCSLEDVEDARSVAYHLGMPYYVFNLSDAFRDRVVDPFVASYQSGRTPNPCIDCNRFLKFDRLYERARILGCDAIATGHYARITCVNGKYELKKAVDLTKDQSYVLYSLTQEQLSRTRFPLGELNKDDVRNLAEKYGFRNARKPDSQDICFVPDGDYAAFIERTTGQQYPEGDFLNLEGRVIGRHRGIIHYTVGQRRGLGVPGSSRLYVSKIDPERNTVTLTEEAGLMVRRVLVEAVNFCSGEAPNDAMRVSARLRYRQKERQAVAEMQGERLQLTFDEPLRAPAPGQAAVLYDGDTVLGGGTIVGSEA